MIRPLLAAGAALILLFASQPVSADVVDVKTRDTTIRVLIEGSEKPSHVVVLFAGGDGAVGIDDDGAIGDLGGNFVVRTRNMLHDRGMATVVLAAPGDMPSLLGMRDRDNYARDVENVMVYLRGRFKETPIWMHGTSRGTISIVFTLPKFGAAANRPDGVVLSSAVTRGAKYPHVFQGEPGTITGAVLVLHHKDDPCKVTPVDGAKRPFKSLTAANPKKLMLMEGGGQNARGKPCHAFSHHGFIDIEERVIDAMAGYIKTPN